MVDDSRNMPIVIEDAVTLSQLYLFRLRGNIVNQNIIRPFQIVSLKENESARDGSKAFLVDPVDELHARCVELEKHGGNGLHIFQFRKLVADFDRHRRRAESQKERSV